MAHSFDMLTFHFLLEPPQPFTGLFFHESILIYLVQIMSIKTR